MVRRDDSSRIAGSKSEKSSRCNGGLLLLLLLKAVAGEGRELSGSGAGRAVDRGWSGHDAAASAVMLVAHAVLRT